MTEIRKNRLLMVSFYYPPAGGLALPGSQRVAKFVRYLEQHSVSVLTLDPECYPGFISSDFHKELPIKGEKIFLTRSYDPFQLLLALRNGIRGALGKRKNPELPLPVADAGSVQTVTKEGASVQTVTKESPSSVQTVPKEGARALLQDFKDWIYDLCYFPDGASGWIIPALLAGRNIVRREGIDVVFATGMPWSSLVVAWLLHRVTGVSFVVDFRDPWIGNPFHQSKGVLLDRLGRCLERSIVRRAALITVNTEPLRDEFLARYPDQQGSKFVVLTNGFDPEDFSVLAAQSELAADVGPTRLILAHAGFLYGKRDPAPVLEALDYLVKSGRCQAQDFLFLQLGQVQLDYDFHLRYRELLELDLVRDLGQFPYGDCLTRLQQADVLLLIQPNTKTQVPSKLYDYLCINRPILTITPPDGALGQMITGHQFGDLFDQSDIPGIAQRLEELLEQKKSRGTLYANYTQRDSFNVQRIAAALDDHLLRATRR